MSFPWHCNTPNLRRLLSFLLYLLFCDFACPSNDSISFQSPPSASLPPQTTYKYIIVGGGPGGLQMARFLQQKNRSYILIEKNHSVASFFMKYPIHRRLISINKMYAGKDEGLEFHMRHDWNSLLHTANDLDAAAPPPFLFKNYSAEYYPLADHLVDYLQDFSKHYQLNIQLNTNVIDVFQDAKPQNDTNQRSHFTLHLQHSNGTKSTIRCERVIWATGLKYSTNYNGDSFGKQQTTPPGSKFINYPDFSLTGLEKFKHMNIGIVGKGNSAMEVAETLMPYASSMDVMSYDLPKRSSETHYRGDISSKNLGPLGGYQLKSLVSLLDIKKPPIQTLRNPSVLVVEYYSNMNVTAASATSDITNSTGNTGNTGNTNVNSVATAAVSLRQFFHNLKDGTIKEKVTANSPFEEYDLVVFCTGFHSNMEILYRPGGEHWRHVNSSFWPNPVSDVTNISRSNIVRPDPPEGLRRVHVDWQPKYPTIEPWYESSDVNGLYFAGSQMHGRDYKTGSTGFIHGFRYSVRALHKWLEQEVEHQPWPVEWGGDEPWELTGRIHKRIRTTSGLYQMFGVMCDLFVFSEGQPRSVAREQQHSHPVGVAHVKELPCDMVPTVIERNWRPRSTRTGQKQPVRFLTLNLDYGRCYKNEAVMLSTRKCLPENPGCYAQAKSLHPIIRYYNSPKEEDLTSLSAKEFIYSAVTREFHLASDTNMKWDHVNFFHSVTLAFFERLDMERRGMSRDATPLLISERDTRLALPLCEMEIAADLMLHKAKQQFSMFTTLNMKQDDKAVEYKHRYEFFLAQAVKFNPLLWQQLWRGKQLTEKKSEDMGNVENGKPTKLYDMLDTMILENMRKKFTDSPHPGASCTTPKLSVKQCVDSWVVKNKHIDNIATRKTDRKERIRTKEPREDIDKNILIQSERDWFYQTMFVPNSTNNPLWGGSSTPCFMHYNCKQCQALHHCTWQPLIQECSLFHPTNDQNDIQKKQCRSIALEPTKSYSNPRKNNWRDTFPSEEQQFEAWQTRLHLHPSQPVVSFPVLTKKAIASLECNKVLNCSSCIQNNKCTWCAGTTKQCTLDRNKACLYVGRDNQIGGKHSIRFQCPLPNEKKDFAGAIPVQDENNVNAVNRTTSDAPAEQIPKKSIFYDYVIVGAGPAGLQMARHMQEKGRSYVLLEKNSTVGARFVHYPKHRILISINKMHAGKEEGREFHMRHDWNSILHTAQDLDDVPPPPISFQNYTSDYLPHADALVNYLQDFAEHYKLNIQSNSQVVKVYQDKYLNIKNDASDTIKKFSLVVQTTNNTESSFMTVRCKRVIWATGLRSTESFDNIQAPHGKVIRYHDLDVGQLNKTFVNKNVLILGKGNTGMEIAQSIMPFANSIEMLSRNSPKRAVKSHYTGDVREMNEEAIGGSERNSIVTMHDMGAVHLPKKGTPGKQLILKLYNGPDDTIEGGIYVYNQVNKTRRTAWVIDNNFHYVILATGFNGETEVFQQKTSHVPNNLYGNGKKVVHLPNGSKFPNMQPWYESSDVNGLYFAGALMHGRDYKRGNNGFIHGFRYSVRALHKWLEQEVEHQPWPVEWGGDEPWELTGRIHKRIRTTSGLYQMFGVMCDLFVFSEGQPRSVAREQQHSHPVGVAHVKELPCDMVPTVIERNWRPRSTRTGQKQPIRFLTLNLDYARCYKGETVFTKTRFCMTYDHGCFAQTNFLHPILRYYDIKKTDDLLGWTSSKFEHGAVREFHLVEDLETKWEAAVFSFATYTFFERLFLLRYAKSNTVKVPLMLAERDTTIPLVHCDLEKIGEYLFHQADVLVEKQSSVNDRLPSGELFHTVKDKVMHSYYLSQALKFKPELWRKVWKGPLMIRELVDNFTGKKSSDAMFQKWKIGHFDVAQKLVDQAAKRRRLHKLKMERALKRDRNIDTPNKCATPGFSVSHCLSKLKAQAIKKDNSIRSTNNDDGKKLKPVQWFKQMVVQANTTNGPLSRPCFVYSNCNSCNKEPDCDWCMSNGLCTHTDEQKTCKHGKTSAASETSHCTCATSGESKVNQVEQRFGRFLPREFQLQEAYYHRILNHPSQQHTTSLPTESLSFFASHDEDDASEAKGALKMFEQCMDQLTRGKNITAANTYNSDDESHDDDKRKGGPSVTF